MSQPSNEDPIAAATSPRSSNDSTHDNRIPVRVLASLCLVVVVAAMAVTDRFVARRAPNPTADLVDAGPIATGDDARSSTWFCIGGAGDGEAAIVIANPTDQRRSGVVRTFSAAGALGTTNVVLAPGESRDVQLASAPMPTTTTSTTTPTNTTKPTNTTNTTATNTDTTADMVVAPSELGPESERGLGAVLEFDGGGLVAEHRVEGSVAPCAAAASPTWYLPDGATTRDAKTSLTLFNPFADDAIVDVFVTTNTSNARPSALQGVFVPGGTVRTLDLERFVRRRSFLSATVTTRTGRVIAEGFLRFDGSGTARGSSIVSASPTRGSAWYFPSGKSSSVLRERYFLTNPGDSDMTVELAFIAADREEPFEVDIPAKSIVEFDTDAEERVPTGVEYSVVVASTSNRTFLASRRLVAKSKFRRGVASTLGARIQSNRWTIADASADAKIDDRLSIVNPTEDPALVSLFRIGSPSPSLSSSSSSSSSSSDWTPVVGAENIAISGGSRLDIRLGDFVSVTGATFAVLSDGAPVIVDRTRVLVRTRGDRPTRLPLLASRSEDTDTGTDSSTGSSEQASGPIPVAGRGFGVLAASRPASPTSSFPTSSIPTSSSPAASSPAASSTTASSTTTSVNASPVASSLSTAAGSVSALTVTTTTATATTRLATSAVTTTPLTTATPLTTTTVPATTTVLAATTLAAAASTTVPATSTSITATTSTAASSAKASGTDARVAIAVIAQAGLGTSTAIAIPAAGS